MVENLVEILGEFVAGEEEQRADGCSRFWRMAARRILAVGYKNRHADR